MAESTQRVVSDGTLVSVGLSIDFIKQADISVFYNGVPASPATWSWAGPLVIAFSPAVPNGVEVLLRRSTERGEVLNVFADGATFNNDSMDTNFKQTLFLTQEALEGAALTDAFADVDFHGFRPTNLGPAVNPGDAVSLAQYQADVLGAYAHRLAAAASAAAAAASAAEAAASAISINPSSFATAAQGALADSSVQASSPTGAARMPTGTTAQRPATPVVGMQRTNTTTGEMEWWNGTSWAPMGGGATGSGGDKIFFKNGQTITADHTIAAGENAGTFGPITINTGVAVTIADGGTWTWV